MNARLLMVLGIAAALGCREPKALMRIGVKDFTEQRILAEVLAELGRRHDLKAEIHPCADSYRCQSQLAGGQIDMMVEYTGTGILYSGTGADRDLDALRQASERRGIAWVSGLGFDNSFQVAMTRARAATLGVEAIVDLAEHPRALRWAVPPTYLERPSDGYGALLERHGLLPRAEPLLVGDTSERIDALLSGRADVAIVFRTDGELSGLDLAILDDSLGFFPQYEAVVVAREDFTRRHAGLIASIDELSGQVSADRMQELNYRASVTGLGPTLTANLLLSELGLGDADLRRGAAPLRVAVAPSDELAREQEMAVRLLRQAYPKRPIEIVLSESPFDAVRAGAARVALSGGERLLGDADRTVDGVEAVTVVQRRLVHVLRRQESPVPLAGRVGIGPPGSGSESIGERLLAAISAEPTRRDSHAALIAAVTEGELDAAVVVAVPGDPRIATSILEHGLRVVALADPSLRTRLPNLPPARLAPGIYPGHDRPIETLGSQVVLVGAAPSPRPMQVRGPAAALLARRAMPFELEEARRLASLSHSRQVPDAVLPSIYSRLPASDPGKAPAEPAWSPTDSLLNVLALLFIAWLGGLVVARPTPGESERDTEADVRPRGVG